MSNAHPSIGYTLADAIIRIGEPPRLEVRMPYETPYPAGLDDLAELIDELVAEGARLPAAEWPQSVAGQLARQRTRAEAIEYAAPLLDDVIGQLNRDGVFVLVRTNCGDPFPTQLRVEPL